MAAKTRRTTETPAHHPTKPAKKRSTAPKAKRLPHPGSADPGVEAYLRDLVHPMKAEIEGLRRLILGVSAEVDEEVKWNAPSFRTTDHFATFNLHGKSGVRLILHTGAKTKATAKTGLKIPDPAGIIQWQAKDRGTVTFVDAKDVRDKTAPLRAILRAWVAGMRSL